MNKQDLIQSAAYYTDHSEDNVVPEQIAISKAVAGMRMYEVPIFAFGAADDILFRSLRESTAIGPHFILPTEWLPQAKTVISFFLPFTEAIKQGNRRDRSWPSEEWLHARIEGQAFINKLILHLKAELTGAGYESLAPSLDPRFWARDGLKVPQPSAEGNSWFTSNWSERHVAFVCGLGTFGLSKGLITEKGMAGRFGSLITDLFLPPSERKYKDPYEYCSMCGTCVQKCPVNAISLEEGKNHTKCNKFLVKTARKYTPRYGCGKCQTDVPCESKIPDPVNEEGISS